MMKPRVAKASKKLLTLTVLLYGLYLLKTLMGINVSKQFSANWILKAPLQPLLANKTKLCEEFEALCTVRTQIKKAVQYQINHIKHPHQA
jgi:hypothetical protein